jgi:hypothetical protein
MRLALALFAMLAMPALAAAQTLQVQPLKQRTPEPLLPGAPLQRPLDLNPKLPPTLDTAPAGPQSLTGPSSATGLKLPNSTTTITPTLSAPDSPYIPPAARSEERVPGVRLRVPW